MTDAGAVEAAFEGIAAALAGSPGVTFGSGRRGFGSDALQVGGRIFAMVTRGHLVVKLPRARVDGLIGTGDGLPFDAGRGTPMKEWVMLTAASRGRWEQLAREALAFVAGHDRGG